MADSDGPFHDTDDPAQSLPPAARPVAPAPRVNPPNINTSKEAPPAGGPPGFNDFLEWMRSQVGSEAAPARTGQRGPVPKERKKFQRRDLEAKGDAPSLPAATIPEPPARPAPEPEAQPPTSVAAGPTADPDAAVSAKPPLAPAEPLSPRVRRQQGNAQRKSWLGVLTQLGVLVLLAGSFLVGRFSVPKVAPLPPSAPAAPETVNSDGKATTNLLSDENASLIDQAMAAEQDSNFKKAGELFGKVKASGAHVPGLSFQLGQLAVFEGDYHKALPLLNEAIAKGENIADAYNMRATLGSRTPMIRNGGLSDYEVATKVAPFDARNYYYWGAALRRTGKVQAAIVRLQQAIDRLREPELESSYRLSLRLTKIEAGQEKDFADELARQLALPNPTMDWLITAAAVEMHRGNFTAAADYLDKAAQRGDPEAFKLRLRDFYLSQFQYEKELARFYPKTAGAKPNGSSKPPGTGESPAPDAAAPPAIGLEMPPLPPPASPGASLPH